jgi:Fe-S cluster assembly ATP-binding protein
MGILKIENLSLARNGNKILDNINIDFCKDRIYAVVGPNGAGKTTLGFVIMGIGDYKDFTGDILYKGKSVKNLNVYERAREGITLAWQDPARFDGLTVEKFIKFSSKDKTRKSVVDALEKVGMSPVEYLERAVDKTLSGGERKKIELASILVMKPELVVLDEPDSGIDIASLENIFDSIKLLKSSGATVILITHSLEVLQQAEYAFLLCNGSIIQRGSIKEISGYFKGKCIPCDHKNLPEEMEP